MKYNNSNHILSKCFYNEKNEIEKIEYYGIQEKQFFIIDFKIYLIQYKDIFPFRNAILVEDKYFRARTHRDINSFMKIGGTVSNGTIKNGLQTERDIKSGSNNGARCEDISKGNGNKDKRTDTDDLGRNHGNDIFQRELERHYTKPDNSSFIIRNVRKADRVNPTVFKKCFSNARKDLPKDVQYFVTIRNKEELKDFECLAFSYQKNVVPYGYVAVNRNTGDICSLLRDKTSYMKQFTLSALANAIYYGGTKLDCYTYPDKGLGYIYTKHGFMPVCRVKFDITKADKTYVKEVGTPDIVMFMLIETGNPKLFLDSYVDKVLNEKYIPYNEYHYVPFVDEVPELREFADKKGWDDYTLGLYVRDLLCMKWKTLSNKYKGKENTFVKDYIHEILK